MLELHTLSMFRHACMIVMKAMPFEPLFEPRRTDLAQVDMKNGQSKQSFCYGTSSTS